MRLRRAQGAEQRPEALDRLRMRRIDGRRVDDDDLGTGELLAGKGDRIGRVGHVDVER